MLGGLLGWLMSGTETIEAKPARKTPEKRKGQHREKVLSAAAVRAAKPGFHPDGNGLYLKVDPSGAKRWIQRLVVGNRRVDIGLGSAALVGLADAREAALANRKLARAGGDPLAARRQAEAVLSFEAASRKVHDLHKGTWRNPMNYEDAVAQTAAECGVKETTVKNAYSRLLAAQDELASSKQ